MKIIKTPKEFAELRQHLQVKKPVNLTKSIIFSLFNNVEENLYFLTPQMYIPYDYKLADTDKTRRLVKTFDIIETTPLFEDSNFVSFVENLYELTEHIIGKINKYERKFLQNRSLFRTIDKDQNLLRFNNIYQNNINVYNRDNVPYKFNNLTTGMNIKCLFAIKNIWISDTLYGFNLIPIEILICDYINTNPLTIEHMKRMHYITKYDSTESITNFKYCEKCHKCRCNDPPTAQPTAPSAPSAPPPPAPSAPPPPAPSPQSAPKIKISKPKSQPKPEKNLQDELLNEIRDFSANKLRKVNEITNNSNRSKNNESIGNTPIDLMDELRMRIANRRNKLKQNK